jgi:hypothetical protein
MSKIPPILLKKLAGLRRRERLLRLVWGMARVTAVVLVALLVACAIDWIVDLFDETPSALRLTLLVGQLVLAGMLVLLQVLLPLLKRLRDDKLALFVEEKRPELQHRLISALQLNRAWAPIEGMSPELLAAVTQEATQQVAPLSLAALADHRRILRGVLVLAPVVLLAGCFGLLFPDTVLALLQRQMLEDVDIPRSIALTPFNHQGIWPSGEEVVLHFTARGPASAPVPAGTVRIQPDGQPSFTVPLTLLWVQNENTAVYAAKLPPSSVDFGYSARLGDGRTRTPNRVKYVPRPNIEQQEGYLILPAYVGLRPDGKPYEQHQPTGDIAGMAGLSARIVAKVQKPVSRAVLRTYGSPYPDLAAPTGLSQTHQDRVLLVSALSGLALGGCPLDAAAAAVAGQTTVQLRELWQDLEKGTQRVEWTIDLRPTETSYSIVVFDEYWFASKTMTVRSLKIEPEPPPSIVLHAERWDPKTPYDRSKNKTTFVDFEGLPLPITSSSQPGNMRISYEAFGPYGIGKVQLKIGVFRGQSNSGERLRRGIVELWATLELEEFVVSRRRPRPFDLSTGAFEDSRDKEQVLFYALPVPPQEQGKEWPRKLAGGRFDYKVAGFRNVRTGEAFEFQPGDHLVVYLEVFNRNPDPKKAVMAKSQKVREKDLATMEDFLKICSDTLQEASRIETLMYMQQQVYDRPWMSIFGFK